MVILDRVVRICCCRGRSSFCLDGYKHTRLVDEVVLAGSEGCGAGFEEFGGWVGFSPDVEAGLGTFVHFESLSLIIIL